MPTIAAAKLADFVAAIMHGAGCGRDEAATIARRLVDSNLVGHDSHGVLRVPRYLEWIKDGTLRPNMPPTVVFDSDTIAVIGGTDRRLSTNPITIGVPVAGADPVVLDDKTWADLVAAAAAVGIDASRAVAIVGK